MSGEHYKPVEWFVNLSPAAGSTGSKFGLAVEEAIGLVQTIIKSKISQEFFATNGPIKYTKLLRRISRNNMCQQECIPVGCVPSGALAVSWGGGVCSLGSAHFGECLCLAGVCPGGVC